MSCQIVSKNIPKYIPKQNILFHIGINQDKEKVLKIVDFSRKSLILRTFSIVYWVVGVTRLELALPPRKMLIKWAFQGSLFFFVSNSVKLH